MMLSSNHHLLVALSDGTKSESKMQALRLMLEFGSASQKAEAIKEIQKVAFGDQNREPSEILDSGDEDENDDCHPHHWNNVLFTM